MNEAELESLARITAPGWYIAVNEKEMASLVVWLQKCRNHIDAQAKRIEWLEALARALERKDSDFVVSVAKDAERKDTLLRGASIWLQTLSEAVSIGELKREYLGPPSNHRTLDSLFSRIEKELNKSPTSTDPATHNYGRTGDICEPDAVPGGESTASTERVCDPKTAQGPDMLTCSVCGRSYARGAMCGHYLRRI